MKSKRYIYFAKIYRNEIISTMYWRERMIAQFHLAFQEVPVLQIWKILN
jgi:hypothetical protein